jgi:glycosyltransferase involved in cell wall biosynthesis
VAPCGESSDRIVHRVAHVTLDSSSAGHTSLPRIPDSVESSGKANAAAEVILCTFNGARFIGEQLASILRQSVPVERISIYDDRSTDGTAEVVRDLLKTLGPDLRERVFLSVNSRNVGYAENFSQGISNSCGDVLFLCDQDDVWEPDKVATLLSLIRRLNVDLAFSDGHLVDESGNPLSKRSVLQTYGLRQRDIDHFGDSAFQRLVKRNYINGASIAIRRSAAIAALPPVAGMPHDYWLAIWCSLHAGVAGTSKRLYRYRQHSGNAIGVGLSRPVGNVMSIWRRPRHARDRELMIWNGVMERIGGLPSHGEIELGRQKQAWLTNMLSDSTGVPVQAVEIARSLIDGSYRRFSPDNAPLRDIVTLIRQVGRSR